jgi:hypothetical protein
VIFYLRKYLRTIYGGLHRAYLGDYLRAFEEFKNIYGVPWGTIQGILKNYLMAYLGWDA